MDNFRYQTQYNLPTAPPAPNQNMNASMNMSMNMEASFRGQCAICTIDLESEYVDIGCSHHICEDCALQLVMPLPNLLGFEIKCPHCSKFLRMHTRDISPFVQKKQHTRHISYRDGNCPYHRKMLAYFCRTCMKPMCHACYGNTYHSGHEVRTIDETMTEFSKDVHNLNEEISSKKGKLVQRFQYLVEQRDKEIADANRHQESLRKEIAELHELLNTKEAQLANCIEKKRESRLTRLETELNNVTNNLEVVDRAVNLVNGVCAASYSNDPLAFFELVANRHKEVEDAIAISDCPSGVPLPMTYLKPRYTAVRTSIRNLQY